MPETDDQYLRRAAETLRMRARGNPPPSDAAGMLEVADQLDGWAGAIEQERRRRIEESS